MFSGFFSRTSRTIGYSTLGYFLIILLWAPLAGAAEDFVDDGGPRPVIGQETIEESDEDDISRPMPMPEPKVEQDDVSRVVDRVGIWQSLLRIVAWLRTAGLAAGG